jgi:large subunit ribosomal protein MRP49
MIIAFSDDQIQELPTVTEHQPVEFACAASAGTWLALAVDGQSLEPFLHPGDTTWRWLWNPGAAVGLHRATLARTAPEGTTERAWTLRVAPRKLDQEHYELLLDDVQRVACNLAYTLGAGAEGATLARHAAWERSRLEEYYALFAMRLPAFERAVRRIAQRPHEHLRGTTTNIPLGQAARLDDDALPNLARGTFDEAPAGVAMELQEALRPGGGLLPRMVPAARSAVSYDTYEHRLLRQLLATLWRRARFIGQVAEREVARLQNTNALIGTGSSRLARAQEIMDGCVAAAHTLRELRGLPFLAAVQPLPSFRGASPLLQRDPHYREVYRMWQALRQHPYLAFDTPLCAIPIADLPRLYEVWCALKVAQALLDSGGAVQEQRLVAMRSTTPDEELVATVDLVEDAPLLVITHGEQTLTLRYQPRYRPAGKAVASRQSAAAQHAGKEMLSSIVHHSSSLHSLDRFTHVPDLAVEVEWPGAAREVLLLDAKYRVQADGRNVPPDALSDAYTYRGAIGVAGQRATRGALLLFPGRGGAEVYASGVGVVPLVPGSTTELAHILDMLLQLPSPNGSQTEDERGQ